MGRVHDGFKGIHNTKTPQQGVGVCFFVLPSCFKRCSPPTHHEHSVTVWFTLFLSPGGRGAEREADNTCWLVGVTAKL